MVPSLACYTRKPSCIDAGSYFVLVSVTGIDALTMSYCFKGNLEVGNRRLGILLGLIKQADLQMY